jgi:hypothetical protein
MRGDQRHIPAVFFCSSGKNSILTILQVKSQVTIKTIKSGIIIRPIKLNSTVQYSKYIHNPRGKIYRYSQNYQKWNITKKKNFVCHYELIEFILILVNPVMLFFYFPSSRSHAAVPLQRE